MGPYKLVYQECEYSTNPHFPSPGEGQVAAQGGDCLLQAERAEGPDGDHEGRKRETGCFLENSR